MFLPSPRTLSSANSTSSTPDPHYLSGTSSAITATVTLTLALVYFCSLFWSYRYSQRHPRPLNKLSGVRLQRYGPAVYAFMVFSALAETAIATWLLLQYRFNNNYPNVATRTGVRFVLFCACWTTLTAGAYTLLFLHPVWSKRAVSSIGAQAIWVFVTWLFWILGAAMVNGSLPNLFARGRCSGLVYCQQVQALFVLSVLEILALTAGMLTLIWLAWQSGRDILRPASSG